MHSLKPVIKRVKEVPRSPKEGPFGPLLAPLIGARTTVRMMQYYNCVIRGEEGGVSRLRERKMGIGVQY